MHRKRFLFETITDIPSTPISPARFDLPANYSVFLDPGTYAVYDDEYDCTLPGLYRWQVSQELNILCRIVSGDLHELISCMCLAQAHGAHDNGRSNEGLYSLNHFARARKLRLTCGNLVIWIRGRLSTEGYTHRQVHLLTLEPPNNTDDGHITIEVQVNGKWHMFDVANSCYFTHEGVHLDTQEFMDLVQAGVRPQKHILAPPRYNAELYLGQWCYATYAEMAWIPEEAGWEWYKRIFQSIIAIN